MLVPNATPIELADTLALGVLGSRAWWEGIRTLGTPLLMKCTDRVAPAVETQSEHEAPRSLMTFLWRQTAGVGRPLTVLIEVDGYTPHPMASFTAMTQVPETDVWYVSLWLPPDALCSYVIVPVPAEAGDPPTEPKARRAWWCRQLDAHGQADPFSRWPAQATGWGQVRATLRMGPWAALEHQRQAQEYTSGQGQQWVWHSARLARSRRVWWHAPSRPGDRVAWGERPWVLLLDGQAWAEQQSLFVDLDRVTSQGLIPPACYLAVDACDGATRSAELGCRPAFWEALHEELLPQAWATVGLEWQRPAMLVAGQSLGGLAALYAGLQWPQRYAAVISQSGAFWWPELDPDAAEHAWLLQRVRSGWRVGQAVPCLLQYGLRDQDDMRQISRDMACALTANGQRVHLQEYAGGHDWLCWREALLDGLASMLPTLHRPQAIAATTNQNTVSKTTSFGRSHESESRYCHQPLR